MLRVVKMNRLWHSCASAMVCNKVQKGKGIGKKVTGKGGRGGGGANRQEKPSNEVLTKGTGQEETGHVIRGKQATGKKGGGAGKGGGGQKGKQARKTKQ